MKVDEVCAALGLEPFDEFAKARMDEWKSGDKERELGKKEFRRFLMERRGTGRTLRMICEALADVSEGHVVHIYGHNQTYTRELVHRARAYASQLGLDAGKILLRPVGAQRVYRDHYYPLALFGSSGV